MLNFPFIFLDALSILNSFKPYNPKNKNKMIRDFRKLNKYIIKRNKLVTLVNGNQYGKIKSKIYY